jgi:hypothetical protein
MWTRRHFLSSASLALAAGASFALPGDRKNVAEAPAELPDGSASKGMIDQPTDQAINNALEYLYKNQHPNGSFGWGGYNGNVAVTSLAGLAFMSGGHQPNRGRYGTTIINALRSVLSHAHSDGIHGFLCNRPATPHGPMYGHGFGTLFLAEVSGMVHDPVLRKEVRETLHSAVDLILRSQNREGGWRYEPGSIDADLSVTICQIMALRAARNAGVGVPKEKVDRCVDYVRACQNRLDGSFRYMKQGGGGGGMQGFARTAAGVAALYSAGIYQGHEIDLGLQFLVRWRPLSFGRPDMHFFYGHYYAMQVMWTAGGQYWPDWYPKVRDDLIKQQNGDGSWIDQIDVHYATAMASIILQVPNNYLTILQK